jgi:hypothetical protein
MTEGGKLRRRMRDEEESYGSSDDASQLNNEGINEEGDNEESSKEEQVDDIDPDDLSAIDSFAQT